MKYLLIDNEIYIIKEIGVMRYVIYDYIEWEVRVVFIVYNFIRGLRGSKVVVV